MTTLLLESCRIAPAPGVVGEHSLPFTFFDIIWLHFHPIRRLFFYEIPCSKAYFLETLLPKLKHSLSVALKHYYPLAGSLFYPLKTDTEKPIIRYVPGDSVSLTIFESTNDFENLVGYHPRDADIFYELIPQTNMVDESNHKLLQLLSLQVTVFPGRGVCVGFANHHSICDDTSFMAFINCWASINKLGGDLQRLQSFPLFERSLVKDPVGVDSVLWNQVKDTPLQIPSFPLPTNRVRATYVLSQTELKKLKDLVLARNPGLFHVSSFVVTTAYIWSCLTKSLVVAGEESGKVDDSDECNFFLFAVDSRARLDPPLPGNYFGNCLSYGLDEIRHEELVGDEGFLLAAKAIALEIQNKVNDKEKILKGVENWVTEINYLFTSKRLLSVSGSAKVDLYSSADFGWGKAKKLEMLSIDAEKYSISLSKSRDFEGGLEVGLSLPKLIMDAFAAIFHDGIKLI